MIELVYSPPLWATIIAAAFLLITVTLSVYLLFEHLSAYKNPEEQKFFIGVILMVPCYSIESFVSLVNPSISGDCGILRELGERLMAQIALDYESTRGRSGDIKMLINTQRSGTATDKVSAFSVLVGDNPIAILRSLDALLGMVTSKVGKRHALTGFEALQELFIASLLPYRKLKTLIQQPLNHLPENKDGYSLLLFWYWEVCLKQRYERFFVALEEASRDMLPALKNKSLKTIYV